MTTETKKFKLIVSLDGGGMKGLMTLFILKYLEKTLGVDICSKADLLCGTSTGGILAFAKMRNLSNEELETIYLDMGKIIMPFSCTNIFEDFSISSTKKYKEQLLKYFPGNIMDFCTEKKGFVVSCYKPLFSKSHYEPFIFSNYENKKRKGVSGREIVNIPVNDAIRATSGVPLLFQLPKYNEMEFMDGGVLYNNPVKLCFNESRQMFGDENVFVVLSFGTGHYKKNIPPKSPELNKTSSPAAMFKKKLMEGIKTIESTKLSATSTNLNSMLKTIKSNVFDSHKTHLDAKRDFSFSPSNINYFRFDPIISKKYSLNDCSKDSIAQMRQDVDQYLSKEKIVKRIDELKSILIEIGIIPK
ncbi:hypothetical protein CYY_000484 [Polysphondylium violaceum]|uniref:PNPLA domain-containing protein n=1 Tax=Polysphondylium violaceum TaxID=133409 RepID=A0A8J4VBH4_9MYCE|nr:hypothetical protein CYY_000484 [Polysphondylium violaceum]